MRMCNAGDDAVADNAWSLELELGAYCAACSTGHPTAGGTIEDATEDFRVYVLRAHREHNNHSLTVYTRAPTATSPSSYIHLLVFSLSFQLHTITVYCPRSPVDAAICASLTSPLGTETWATMWVQRRLAGIGPLLASLWVHSQGVALCEAGTVPPFQMTSRELQALSLTIASNQASNFIGRLPNYTPINQQSVSEKESAQVPSTECTAINQQSVSADETAQVQSTPPSITSGSRKNKPAMAPISSYVFASPSPNRAPLESGSSMKRAIPDSFPRR
jgi:hypothetical protein